MTKVGKILTVLLVFASVTFMGVASVNWVVSTNYKTQAAEFPEKIDAQKKEIADLDTEIPRWEARLKDAEASIKADVAAIKRRQETVEKQLKALHDELSDVNAQVVAETKKAQAVRDEAKLRREEAIALSNQLEELRSQKDAALFEQKRLSALLVQATGTLERVERRKELLEKDGASLQKKAPDAAPRNSPAGQTSTYDPPAR